MRFLYIATGGAIGALLRYAIAGLPHRYFEAFFPYGTLLVNFIGCFVIGSLWGAFEETAVPSTVRTFVFIGILGAFTTFSSYTLETFNLLRDGEVKLALANIVISNIGCIVLCFLGFVTSKWVTSLFR
ncbi:MAG: fluoride efflux transporter CrcB [Chloroflexi bacterium]|nr:fluoride efflux transporter CrcB [Chloroflexota bacterium]